jgi:hypothetical protein
MIQTQRCACATHWCNSPNMEQNSDLTLLEWMDIHARVLFRHTSDKQIENCAGSPRFYLARTRQGNFHRIRNDLPTAVNERLLSLASHEPNLAEPGVPPRYAREYSAILAEAAPIERKWHGPAYRFPTQIPMAIQRTPYPLTQIDDHNIDLLHANHQDWIPDVGTGDPVCALVVAGDVVSVCFSATMSDIAFEAGVDTLEPHRQRGYAVAVVAFWAQAVRDLGYQPLYSTSTDNLASQATAAKLGLIPIGDDFHIT